MRWKWRHHARLKQRLAAPLAASLLAALLVTGTPPQPVSAAPAAPADAQPCASATTDERSAQQMAQRCHAQVEVMSGRSEYGQVFVNPDGTTTMTTSPSPRWVRRADGTWADIDTTLARNADGSLAPAATSTDVTFSGGGDTPLVTLKNNGKKFSLSWPERLPTPTISGSTATYANVLPDVDLTVTATSTGFQHVLVVHNAAAARNPALRKIVLKTGGDVRAKATSDGHVRFVDASGTTVAGSSTASIWDSSIDQSKAGEVLPGVTDQALAAARANPAAELVSNAVRPGISAVSTPLTVGADASGNMVLSPSYKALTSPDTVFPLFIDPSIAPAENKWAYANNINDNWDVGGQAWVGMNPYDDTLYRSFFDFPSTSGTLTWKGKKIISGSMNIWVDHTWSCTDTWSHLYRPNGNITSANGARMSWTTRPLGSSAIWLASAESHANEAGGCGTIQPDELVTFTNSALKSDLQTAATGNFSLYTVGICACNSSNQYENSQDRWKKYFTATTTGGHPAPALSVTFDTPPGTPTNLAPVHGIACGSMIGTTSPVLEAKYVDADSADTLSATFSWKLGSGAVTNVAGPSKPANNVGTVTLNLGSTAEGKTYSFQVQTKDNSGYTSPWSAWCSFTVNASAPTKPNIVSSTYPSCDPGAIDTCPQAGGPGVSGQFTFSEPVGDTKGQDVVSYTYGWTSPPTTTVTVASGQPSPAISLTPPHYGLNTVYAFSKDGAGTPSPISTYTFLVNAPSAALAYWPLDDIRNHGFVDQVSGGSLTPTGNVTWVQNARYEGAQAAHFDATGSATGTVSGLDTSKSFSVAAWVRMTSLSTGNMTAVGMDGTDAGGFYLGTRYGGGTPSVPYWCFMMMNTSASATGGSVGVFSTTALTTADVGKWFYLVGVYDAGEKKMRLYVNGSAQEVARPATPWNATGPFSVGRGFWEGAPADQWRGEIADVRAWNRVVTTDDINGTDADPDNGIPAQQSLMSPMQVGLWDFNGSADTGNSLDGAYFGRSMNLDPGWVNQPPSSYFVLNGHDGNEGLSLDGVSGYASTTDDSGVQHPVLRTDQSLTVAAWVNVTALTGVDQVIVRQGSSTSSALKLFVAANNKYAFAITTPDGAGGYIWSSALSDAVATPGEWVHLVGVFDASAGETRLYVNGVLQAAKGLNAVGWDSTNSLLLGTTGGDSYYGGLIDDVTCYQGILNDREIADLYGS